MEMTGILINLKIDIILMDIFYKVLKKRKLMFLIIIRHYLLLGKKLVMEENYGNLLIFIIKLKSINNLHLNA